MTPRRGELWWVALEPTRGSEIRKSRPCLVVGTNILNARRRTVVVIPLSTAPDPAPPLLVPISCGGRQAVAVVDQIRAVAKERLIRRLCGVSADEMLTVEEALRTVLEL